MSSFLAAQNSLSLFRGASRTIVLTITNSDGSVFDLTGYTVWFTAKKSISDIGYVLRKKSDNPAQAVVTQPKGGVVEIYFVPGDTKDLPAASYIFDVWIVGTTNRYLVVGPAELKLQDAVTRIE